MNKSELLSLMEKINDYWIGQNPESGDNHWERGAYFIGDIEAYKLTGKKEYLNYALKWAEDNNWCFSRDEDNKSINPDSKLCGQSYLQLMELVPGSGTMENMEKTLEFNFTDPNNDYWWWIDSVYMALPFYAMYGLKTGDERSFEKAYKLFVNTKDERKLYDYDRKLWYRDERFTPDKVKTKNGKLSVWSRGNGWVFGGLARAIDILPEGVGYREKYVEVFQNMAEMVAQTQCPDGLWRASLFDPEEYDMPEASGTLLFTYGLLIGVRCGVLDGSYLEIAMKGFEAIKKYCIAENGRILWVQGVAWDPSPSERDNTNDYAVGTMLLIIKELLLLVSEDKR